MNQLSIFDTGEQGGPGPLVIDAASIYRAFEQVKDERKAKGKRYPLAFVLTVLMLGKLAGEKGINGIVDSRQRKEKPPQAATQLAQRLSRQFDLERGPGSL
jgi:hypothetical protein